MKLKTKAFDPAKYLDDEETIATYLSDMIEGGEPNQLASALEDVARARSASQIAVKINHPDVS